MRSGSTAIRKIASARALCLFLTSVMVSPAAVAADKSSPRWFQSLKNNRIIPGLGLAGVSFGDSMQRVRTVLGQPTRETPVRSMSGEFVSTVWNYEWQDRTLILSFGKADNLFGIRLSDKSFNADRTLMIRNTKLIPGSSVFDLMRERKRPDAIDTHVTCPDDLADGMAYNWKYKGIAYTVCGNNKIYWIDIDRATREIKM